MYMLMSSHSNVSKAPTAVATSGPTDAERLDDLGTILKQQGIITEYSLSSWNDSLDVTISSVLPEEARTVAETVCAGTAGWKRSYDFRVFILTSGDRPAAVCRLS